MVLNQQHMTAIDIILLFITLVALFTGAMKGFTQQLGTLAGLVLGILACRVFGPDVAAWFTGMSSSHPTLMTAAAYFCLFVAVFLGAALVARMIYAILKAVKLGFVNRVAGALFRAALWLIVTSLLINVYLGFEPAQKAAFQNPAKPWRHAVVQLAPKVLGYLNN